MQTLEAIRTFLQSLHTIQPNYTGKLAVVQGHDGLVLVQADYSTWEEADAVLEKMSVISSDLLCQTGVWVLLSPQIFSEALQGTKHTNNV